MSREELMQAISTFEMVLLDVGDVEGAAQARRAIEAEQREIASEACVQQHRRARAAVRGALPILLAGA
jgi:hypothetical protein